MTDICKDFKPNPFYSRKSWCVICLRNLCSNWESEKKEIIDLDPAAGSTYRVTPAHCKLVKKHPEVVE